MPGFVFVSYGRRDEDYVARLVEHLQRAGVEVWRDTEGIGYGDRWEQTIRERVDGCTAVVAVMSQAAEASPHVANELNRARKRGKPILPVLLDGEPFFALATHQHFDARDGQLPDQRFLARLAKLAAGLPGGTAWEPTGPRVTVQPADGGSEWSAVLLENVSALFADSRWAVLVKLSTEEHRVSLASSLVARAIKVDGEIAWKGSLGRLRSSKIPLKDGRHTRLLSITPPNTWQGERTWIFLVENKEIFRFDWGA